jgi:hypothetical protein
MSSQESTTADASTSTVADAPLLVSRKRASHLLGVHISTLYRAEKTGQLTAVRLNPNSQKSAVHYRMVDIQRIAGGRDTQGR